MTRRARTALGFTLIELTVYMGLVTTALMVCAGIEVQAQRTVMVQGALVDIDHQAVVVLGKLRQDVEDARTLEVREASQLIIGRLDGSSVIYRAGARIELSPSGKERARERYRLLTGLTISKSTDPDRIAVIATFKGGEVERTFRRVAAPRREVQR